MKVWEKSKATLQRTRQEGRKCGLMKFKDWVR